MEKWILWACIFLAGVASGGWAVRDHYTGKIAKADLARERAETKARDAATARILQISASATERAVKESADQARVVFVTNTITEKVPVYVKDTATCITVGLVRVLDAAALGVEDPERLSLAPGEFNETCAALGSNALAKSVVGNYGVANANAVQLNNLIDELHKQNAIIEKVD